MCIIISSHVDIVHLLLLLTEHGCIHGSRPSTLLEQSDDLVLELPNLELLQQNLLVVFIHLSGQLTDTRLVLRTESALTCRLAEKVL